MFCTQRPNRGEGRKYLPKKFSEEVFCENYLEHKREKGAKVNEVILISLEASRESECSAAAARFRHIIKGGGGGRAGERGVCVSKQELRQ